jgi:hypothetical protein
MNIGQQMNESMTLQRQSHTKNIAFFLLWLAINIGGWVLLTAVFQSMDPSGLSDNLVYIAFCVIGFSIGIFQWLVLKQRFAMARYEWILASALGLTLGMIGSVWTLLLDLYIVKTPPSSPILHWDPLIGGAIFGLALGICQGIVWRPRLDRIMVWVVVNVLGWSLGMFLPQLIVFFLFDVVDLRSTTSFYTIFQVAFAAIVTGVGLVWFLREQHDLD